MHSTGCVQFPCSTLQRVIPCRDFPYTREFPIAFEATHPVASYQMQCENNQTLLSAVFRLVQRTLTADVRNRPLGLRFGFGCYSVHILLGQDGQ